MVLFPVPLSPNTTRLRPLSCRSIASTSGTPRKAVAVIRVTRSPITRVSQGLFECLDLIASRGDRLQEALIKAIRKLREVGEHQCQEFVDADPFHPRPLDATFNACRNPRRVA